MTEKHNNSTERERMVRTISSVSPGESYCQNFPPTCCFLTIMSPHHVQQELRSSSLSDALEAEGCG
jgi:hypothetical protein